MSDDICQKVGGRHRFQFDCRLLCKWARLRDNNTRMVTHHWTIQWPFFFPLHFVDFFLFEKQKDWFFKKKSFCFIKKRKKMIGRVDCTRCKHFTLSFRLLYHWKQKKNQKYPSSLSTDSFWIDDSRRNERPVTVRNWPSRVASSGLKDGPEGKKNPRPSGNSSNWQI